MEYDHTGGGGGMPGGLGGAGGGALGRAANTTGTNDERQRLNDNNGNSTAL